MEEMAKKEKVDSEEPPKDAFELQSNYIIDLDDDEDAEKEVIKEYSN